MKSLIKNLFSFESLLENSFVEAPDIIDRLIPLETSYKFKILVLQKLVVQP